MTDEAEREEIARAHERWRQNTYAQSATSLPEGHRYETLSGLRLRPLYAPDDLEPLDYERDTGFPGEFPYTRGIFPTMYRGRLWTMRQYAGFGTAAETNARFRYLLEQGQTGLSVAFDLPTQIGYDGDHPLAAGEVGRVGVAISSWEDMSHLLQDLPLETISTSMTINATAGILLSFYTLVAEAQTVPLGVLRGTVQNDILKEYAARGTYIYPIPPAMRLAMDLVAWAAEEMPQWYPISISGYHMREAGCTAIQEIAFTFAHAIAYVEHLVARGLAVDTFAPRLSFFFAAQTDVLEEVAKFRAARRLWAHLMRERFGAEDPRSWQLRFHTQTAGVSLTAQQPENNVVRVALQSLAALLGGTQSLHANSMDEALGLPTEKAARLALRTQQILAHESGVAQTVDPTAGAYTIEALTSEIEAQVERYLRRIQQLGGTLRALEKGFIQGKIAEEAYRAQRAVEDETRRVVGVNAYAEEAPLAVPITRIDPQVEETQVQALRSWRGRRDAATVESALAHLREVGEGEENVMPAVRKSAEARATLGEISDALRDVFGTFSPLREF